MLFIYVVVLVTYVQATFPQSYQPHNLTKYHPPMSSPPLSPPLTLKGVFSLTVNASQFFQYSLVQGNIDEVLALGDLAGNVSTIVGWFEYNVQIPQSGWYQLIAPNVGYGLTTEFIFDTTDRRHPYIPTLVSLRPPFKERYYLTAGNHVLRIQKLDATGFGQYHTQHFQWFQIVASSPLLDQSIYISFARNNTVYKLSDTIELSILYGLVEANLTAVVANASNITQQFASYSLHLPATTPPMVYNFSIPALLEGQLALLFYQNGTQYSPNDVPFMLYYVIDTTPPPRTSANMEVVPVQSIDCVQTPPTCQQYQGSEIITSPAGTYRQSIGDEGWNPHGNANSSWMAYRLALDEYNAWYQIEVYYPDDTIRGFSVAIIDYIVDGYPPNSGSEVGWEYSITNTMQRDVLYYYSRTLNPTVIMWNDMGTIMGFGIRIALTAINVSKVLNPFPGMATPESQYGQRKFIYWYEEAWSYIGLFGGVNDSPGSIIQATENWLQQTAYAGFSTIASATVSYNDPLYPTSYEIGYSSEWTINSWVLALKCEKYGLDLIAEFNPVGIMLQLNSTPTAGDYMRNIAVSNTGSTVYGPMWFFTTGPLYNILKPEVQQWFIDLVGEFVDEARYYNALSGIMIRNMASWWNSGFGNLFSLDWGYDDWTIGQFTQDTGIQVPGNETDPKRFADRYSFLTSNAILPKWRGWRCGRMTSYLQAVLTRIRTWNPQMALYLHHFELFPTFPNSTDWGIDPEIINQIEGIHLVNAFVSHGRRRYYTDILRNRDELIDPQYLLLFYTNNATNSGAYFDITAQYFENSDPYLNRTTLGYNITQTAKSTTVAEHDPSGRHALERYALPLALGDAFSVGDGGDQIQTGDPIIREFIAEYRFLPALSFSPRIDAIDPVSVWELSLSDYFMFYVVSRERFPTNVSISLSGTNAVRRVTTGQIITGGSNGVITLTLLPYQLMVFTAAPKSGISGVKVNYDPFWSKTVQEAVEWVASFSANQTAHPTINTDWIPLVQNLSAAARQAFSQGYIWSARTILERSILSQAYMAAGPTQPTGLRNVFGPIDVATDWIVDYDSTVLLNANINPPPPSLESPTHETLHMKIVQ